MIEAFLHYLCSRREPVKLKRKNMARTKNIHHEEIANTLTHGAGLAAGLVACIFLLRSAVGSGDGWVTGSIVIYSLGMLSSYITSSLYHGASNPFRKRILRRFDHSAIYVFIAGTYTPFMLITLRNEGYWGWSIFGIVWTIAVAGTILSFRKMKKKSHLKTVCYLAMGWVIVVAFKPLLHTLRLTGSTDVLYWLIGGGLFYTLGSVFFFFDKYRYMHPLWHVFVMGGTACHFWAIYLLTL